MSECTHDCSSCSADCASRGGGIPKEQLNELSSVKKVIGVVSGKGGVGKSLVTSLLATALSRAGKRVAVLDADITGPSIPKIFGITEKARGDEAEHLYPQRSAGGVDVMSINLLLEDDAEPVIWRGPVVSGVIKQFWSQVVWQDIDYMLIDMPPGTGDVQLTVFQSLPVDGIVIVATPQSLVSLIVEKAARMADMMDVPILGIIENMSYFTCPDCGGRFLPFGESHVGELAQSRGIPLLAQLALDPARAAQCDAGRIHEADTRDIQPAADRLLAL